MTAVTIGPWQTGLTDEQADPVRALFARVRDSDRRGPGAGDLPGPDAAVLPAAMDGDLVGLAWRSGDDPAELVVDPPHRRRGHGRALAERVLPGGGIWAHGTLPAAAALAESLGARPVRSMLQLRRDLAGPFVPELPDGVEIRTFVPGQDDAAFLGVNARAFAWHPEQGRLDHAGLAAQMAERWFDPGGFFLAVWHGDRDGTEGADPGTGAEPAPGTVLGFHWTKVHAADPTPPPGASGPVGEVYVLGVDPASPIRRLGTPLTVAGLRHLALLGLTSVMLYVESDNGPALRLYRRLGFADYAADTVFARD